MKLTMVQHITEIYTMRVYDFQLKTYITEN